MCVYICMCVCLTTYLFDCMCVRVCSTSPLWSQYLHAPDMILNFLVSVSPRFAAVLFHFMFSFLYCSALFGYMLIFHWATPPFKRPLFPSFVNPADPGCNSCLPCQNVRRVRKQTRKTKHMYSVHCTAIAAVSVVISSPLSLPLTLHTCLCVCEYWP